MRTLSQVLPVLVMNTIMLQIGMNLGYISILIPKLANKNATDIVYINEAETPWLTSLIPLMSLIGSLFSGSVSTYFGRKRSGNACVIPILISWIAFGYSKEPWHIFASLSLHGLVNGLVEASVVNYVTEVTEPHLRGMLTTTTTLTLVFGVFLECVIGSLLHWRTAALVTCTFAIANFCLFIFMPESPHWLLLHNKPDDARRSLAWLRGWTTIQNVEPEFQELQRYVKGELIGVNPVLEDDNGTPSSTKNDENAIPTEAFPIRFFKKSFIWPLSLVGSIFVCINFSGIFTVQAYAAFIFGTLKVPLDEYHATVAMSLSQLLGSLLCVYVVRLCGKRIMGLISLSCLCVCNICVGLYAYVNNIAHLDFTHVECSTIKDCSWLPFILLVVYAVSGNCGPRSLPFIIMGEVFSNYTRGVECTLCLIVHYVTSFLTKQLYLYMDSVLTFPGIYWTYASVCFVGVSVVYLALPETEGKTLEEISLHFSGHDTLTNKVERKPRSSRC